MKLSAVAFASFLISANSFASPIPADQLAEYVRAIKISLSSNQLFCRYAGHSYPSPGGSLANEFDSVNSGELSEQGTQPALVLTADHGTVRIIYNVTTAPDDRMVVAIDLHEETVLTEYVNQGTILNPVIVPRTTVIVGDTISCR